MSENRIDEFVGIINLVLHVISRCIKEREREEGVSLNILDVPRSEQTREVNAFCGIARDSSFKDFLSQRHKESRHDDFACRLYSARERNLHFGFNASAISFGKTAENKKEREKQKEYVSLRKVIRLIKRKGPETWYVTFAEEKRKEAIVAQRESARSVSFKELERLLL